MSTKRQFIKGKADKRINNSDKLIRVIVVLMGLVVLYDSFRHNTPLYYILFLVPGALIGRVYYLTHRIKLKEEGSKLILKTNRWSFLMLLLTISVHFFLGQIVLESLQVIWTRDALYLFFIGLYHAKWRAMVRQIDEIYYTQIFRHYE